jgi:hypothetical protein
MVIKPSIKSNKVHIKGSLGKDSKIYAPLEKKIGNWAKTTLGTYENIVQF